MSSIVSNQSDGICLQPIEGTTGNYPTAINAPGAPCFASDAQTLTLPVGNVDITLANLSVLKTGKARAIRFSTLEAICAALECQPGDLLAFDANVPSQEG